MKSRDVIVVGAGHNGLVAACYLLVNLAYLLVLGHDGLAASTAPAADLMGRVFGDSGRRIIAIGIAISTLGFCNISLIGAARAFAHSGDNARAVDFYTNFLRVWRQADANLPELREARKGAGIEHGSN